MIDKSDYRVCLIKRPPVRADNFERFERITLNALRNYEMTLIECLNDPALTQHELAFFLEEADYVDVLLELCKEELHQLTGEKPE